MVEVITYKNRWLREFNLQKKKIDIILRNKALAIHHIGATSLPNIATRDIIDIQLTVPALTSDIEQLLKIIGYNRVGHVVKDRKPRNFSQMSDEKLAKWLFVANPPGVNLHVRLENGFNQRRALLFRDYLRSEFFTAKAYEEMKKQLAKHFPEDNLAYDYIKDELFDIIMNGAELWAETVGWIIPPSD